jgi:predicted NAD/FAD-binding protein
VLICAIAGEALADRQLRAFREAPDRRGKVCDVGLWRWPRHPNYLNRLQALPGAASYFVTLNPATKPRDILREEQYTHPLFDYSALKAQERLWSLQGDRNTWFCGAYFGAGFHEEGLQAGLAVAEDLGGARRPWQVDGESSRIHRGLCPRVGALDTVS